MEYISHRRAPALLHTAQRFFLQGRNAPALLPGEGFSDYLAVADKVILAFLHKGGQAPGCISVGAAAEKHRLRPKHFGDLGQQRGAAHGHQAVGHPSHQGLAVMLDRPSDPPHFSPTISSSAPISSRSVLLRGRSARAAGPPLRQLILRGLAFQEGRARAVPAAKQLLEHRDAAVFTPQAQHQHAPPRWGGGSVRRGCAGVASWSSPQSGERP